MFLKLLLFLVPLLFGGVWFTRAMRRDEVDFGLYALLTMIFVLGWLKVLHPNLLGFIAVVLALGVFFFLNAGILSPDNINYPLMQVFITLYFLTSLLYQLNVPLLVMEILYGGIALFGLARVILLRRKRAFLLSAERESEERGE